MFSVFVPTESSLKKAVIEDLRLLPESAVWIDLVNPSAAEDRAVERLTAIAVGMSRSRSIRYSIKPRQIQSECSHSTPPATSVTRTARAT